MSVNFSKSGGENAATGSSGVVGDRRCQDRARCHAPDQLLLLETPDESLHLGVDGRRVDRETTGHPFGCRRDRVASAHSQPDPEAVALKL